MSNINLPKQHISMKFWIKKIELIGLILKMMSVKHEIFLWIRN